MRSTLRWMQAAMAALSLFALVESGNAQGRPPSPPRPGSVDLSLVQSDSSDPAYIGNYLYYNVLLSNLGRASAFNVVLRDLVPAGTRLGYASISKGSCYDSSGTIVCDVGTLAGGDTTSFSLTVWPDSTGTIQNLVWVATSSRDQNPADNTSAESTLVVSLSTADVWVYATRSPEPALVGQPISYSVELGNFGPDLADNVNFHHQAYGLPLQFVSVSSPTGTCQPDSSGTGVSCHWPSLSPGESAHVDVAVVPLSFGFFSSYIQVSASTYDPYEGNNSWNDTVYVSPAAAVNTARSTGGAFIAPKRLALASRSPAREPRLRLDLPQSGVVRLEVFDLAGRNVRTLVNGWLPAGSHEVQWDGRDESGGRASASVYFVRAGDARGHVTGKVVLTR